MKWKMAGRLGAALAGLVAFSPVTLAISADAAPGPFSVRTVEPGADDPIRRLGSCMASGKQTDVLLVLDRSRSLQDTDPDNERVDAAEYLVSRLVSVADSSDTSMAIAVAGFDVDFDLSKSWTDATQANVGPLDQHLESYRSKNQGWETDYWEAVQGARAALADREGDADHCQAWIWFSDGSYELDVRDSGDEVDDYGKSKPYADGELTTRKAAGAAQRAGVQDICRAGGQASQLRVQDVVTLAVGLKTAGSDADFGLMRGIAEAQGKGGTACEGGTTPTPGAFVEVSQLDDLLFAFDEFASPDQKPLENESKLCPKTACAQQAHTFVLDDSIGSVHILGTADADQKLVAIQRDGMADPVLLDPDKKSESHRIGGVAITSNWLSGNTIELDMDRGDGKGWAGLWSLVFIDPDATTASGVARSRIHLQGDIVPAWRGDAAQWHTGEQVQATFGLARIAGGDEVDPADIQGTAVVSAVLEPASGDPVEVAKDVRGAAIARPQPVDLAGVPIGDAVLRVTLELTTKSARDARGRTVPGTALSPQSVDVPIAILPPANYPTVASPLHLDRIEELVTVRGAVEITGPGCVWFDHAEDATTLPPGVSTPAVASSASSQDTCVSVGEGEKATVPVTFDFDALDNGAVNGALQMKAVPVDGAGEPITVDVAYNLEMRKPRDAETFWLVLIGVTLAGVLIPLVLLYGAKWLAARIPGSSLLVGRALGTVDADGQFVPAGGGPLSFDAAQMDTVFVSGGRRRLSLPGGGELVARIGLNPGAPGYVVASFPGKSAASSGRRASNRKLGAIVPTAVAGSWIVAIDSAASGSPAELVVLTNPAAAGLPDLVEDARVRVADVVTALRAKVPTGQGGPTPPQPVDDGGWGANPGTPPQQPSGGGSWDSW